MEHLEDGTFDDSRYPIDFTKLKKLGWNANLNFDELFEKTVKWCSDNSDWWLYEFIQPYLNSSSLVYASKNGNIEKSSSQIELEVASA